MGDSPPAAGGRAAARTVAEAPTVAEEEDSPNPEGTAGVGYSGGYRGAEGAAGPPKGGEVVR